MTTPRKMKHARDPGLWDRLVNERFGTDHPILSGQESIAAAKKLFRHATGKSFTGKIRLTSGNRYTWIRRGVMSVNPDKQERGARGLRALIHDMSHYCHQLKYPKDSPHSARQARLEGRLVEFALCRGFTEGALKKPPAPEKPKPDVVQQRYARMVNRRDKYAKELERSKRLLAKAQREVREYERRHGAAGLMARPSPRERAAKAIARALGRVPPNEREALLVLIMEHAAEGLAVVRGRKGAAEAAYLLGEHMAKGS